jgi:hypothetical protein
VNPARFGQQELLVSHHDRECLPGVAFPHPVVFSDAFRNKGPSTATCGARFMPGGYGLGPELRASQGVGPRAGRVFRLGDFLAVEVLSFAC